MRLWTASGKRKAGEINTAGWSRSAQEATVAGAAEAGAAEEIPLLINADAHSPAHLTRNFDRQERSPGRQDTATGAI